MTEATTTDTLALARRIATLILEKRGTDLVLLDVRALVDYTDFFLLASGQSGRQNQAIGEHVVKTLKADHRFAISKSGLDTGTWICLDLADVVVHVFDPETRARYDLELLWADAPRIDLPSGVPGAELRLGTAVPAAPLPAAAAGQPKKRKRLARVAAVEDADAENAPESARPPVDEPEPEEAAAPAPAAKSSVPKQPRPKRKAASRTARMPKPTPAKAAPKAKRAAAKKRRPPRAT